MKSDAREVDNLLDIDEKKDKRHRAMDNSSGPSPFRDAVALLSDTYLAFLWWTTLTALHPTSRFNPVPSAFLYIPLNIKDILALSFLL